MLLAVEAVGVAILVGSVRGVMGFAGAPEFEEKGLHPVSAISSASSAQVPLQACTRVRDVVGSFPLTRTVCMSACITSCPPKIRRARRKTNIIAILPGAVMINKGKAPNISQFSLCNQAIQFFHSNETT